MLPLALVQEIERLLSESQLSQRKIAARLGVSRGTIGAIASGRRGIYGKEPEAENADSHDHQSPPERCGRCGFTVYLPCLVCRARDFRQRQEDLITTHARPQQPMRQDTHMTEQRARLETVRVA